MAIVLTAAVWDLRVRRIPNWLCVAGAALGIAANSWLLGWPGALGSLEGLALAFGIYFLLYIVRAMGAGDVKLMAAVGSFVGPADWLIVFLITAVLGGVIALVVVVSRGRVRKTLDNVGFIVAEMMHLRAPHMGRPEVGIKGSGAVTLPHGAVIALGCAVFLVLSNVL